MTETAVEALAEAWASMDGKLEAFQTNKADRSLDGTIGHYPGYLEDAREMIRRLETRGYTVVSIGDRDQTTTHDRSWWKNVYGAGIKASLEHKPRTPPDGVTNEQRDVWLAGYDR